MSVGLLRFSLPSLSSSRIATVSGFTVFSASPMRIRLFLHLSPLCFPSSTLSSLPSPHSQSIHHLFMLRVVYNSVVHLFHSALTCLFYYPLFIPCILLIIPCNLLILTHSLLIPYNPLIPRNPLIPYNPLIPTHNPLIPRNPSHPSPSLPPSSTPSPAPRSPLSRLLT